jgi:hypothetical protein
MKYVTLFLLTLSLGLPALGRADSHKLVMGTVYRIVKNLIEVKEDSAGLAVVRIDAATKYINSSTEKPAKLKDLAIGDQIVIKVVTKDGVDTAEEVKFVPALGNR